MAKKKTARKSKVTEWVKAKGKVKSTCRTCRHAVVKDEVQEILDGMLEESYFNITRRDIFDKMCAENEDYTASFSAFRDHLMNHETERWRAVIAAREDARSSKGGC